jgi:glycosyltransferase involved in cell wall biosynthesis
MLTAVVLTYNEEHHLADCLDSLAWAPAVLVFDSFSTDSTVAVALAAHAAVQQRAFDHYAGQRQAALEAVDSEWVFFVDADERVPAALAHEVQSVLARPEPGWWVPRHNYLFGRLTQHAGWYPDYQLRLLRRALAHFDPARPVHELALLNSPLAPGRLKQPLIHHNYDTIQEFVSKQARYARYDASQLWQSGQRAQPHNFLLQPLRQFYWRLITLRGWRAGWHGLRLSALMAYFEWQKYLELRRLQARS